MNSMKMLPSSISLVYALVLGVRLKCLVTILLVWAIIAVLFWQLARSGRPTSSLLFMILIGAANGAVVSAFVWPPLIELVVLGAICGVAVNRCCTTLVAWLMCTLASSVVLGTALIEFIREM